MDHDTKWLADILRRAAQMSYLPCGSQCLQRECRGSQCLRGGIWRHKNVQTPHEIFNETVLIVMAAVLFQDVHVEPIR
uniref:Uncharacterized protein n=1 Tax=Globodera pallida TaxID=36090 RepID=A0A183BLQ0_GLOPA